LKKVATKYTSAVRSAERAGAERPREDEKEEEA
jgi:hypothetical protein